MAESRRRDAWAHTSNVLAMLLNCRPGVKRSNLVNPSEFNPFHAPKAAKPLTVPITILKDLFVPPPPK